MAADRDPSDLPDLAEIRRRLGPLPSAAEVEGIRESVRLYRALLRDLPAVPEDGLDPGHVFPLKDLR